MKKHFLLVCLLMAMGGIWAGPANAQCGDNGDGTFSNPVFWADVPTRMSYVWGMTSTW